MAGQCVRVHYCRRNVLQPEAAFEVRAAPASLPLSFQAQATEMQPMQLPL